MRNKCPQFAATGYVSPFKILGARKHIESRVARRGSRLGRAAAGALEPTELRPKLVHDDADDDVNADFGSSTRSKL